MNQETSSANQTSTQESNSRQSIWAIHSGWATTYFVLFTLQVLVGTAVLTWHEVAEVTHDRWLETYTGIIQHIGEVGISSAITSFIITEVLRSIMLASEWIRHNLLEPTKERQRAEGRAEGRAQGRAELIAEIKDWERRRQAAEDRGESFDEPPPYRQNGTSGHQP